MVDVDIQPERMEFLEHVGQFLGDPHGHEDWDPRADPNDLDVRYLPQAGEELFQQFGRQGERVAAREQYVPYLGSALQIIDLGLKIRPREGGGWVTHNA